MVTHFSHRLFLDLSNPFSRTSVNSTNFFQGQARFHINKPNRSVSDQNTIDYYLDLYGGDIDYDYIDYNDLFKQGTRYSGQSPAYWRFDVGIAYKINKSKSTHSIMFDFQNVTNHQNIHSLYFDSSTNKLEPYYQMGIIPVFNYRIEF